MTFSVCPSDVGTCIFEINIHFAVKYVAPRPGPILEIDTKVQLGQHNGLWTYTIGQGARLPGLARKLFVAGKNRQTNAIYVALSESVQPSLSPPSLLSDLRLLAVTRLCSLRVLYRMISRGFGATLHQLPRFRIRAFERVHRSAIA